MEIRVTQFERCVGVFFYSVSHVMYGHRCFYSFPSKVEVLRTQKTMTMSPSKPIEEYGGFSSYVDRAFNSSLTKIESSPKAQPISKLRSMNTFADLGFTLHRIDDKASTMEEIFSHGLEHVENSTNELKSVKDLMQTKPLLSKSPFSLNK